MIMTCTYLLNAKTFEESKFHSNIHLHIRNPLAHCSIKLKVWILIVFKNNMIYNSYFNNDYQRYLINKK